MADRSANALKARAERLYFLLEQEAKDSAAIAQRFSLYQQIKEAKIRLLELENELHDKLQSAAEAARRLAEAATDSAVDFSASPGGSVGEQIEQAYAEILAGLEESGGDSPVVEAAFSRLRQLQDLEAQEFRQRFEAGLNLPVDAGAAILARARALRKELEDTASSNPAAPQADDP